MKVVWRSVARKCGELFVTISGVRQMLKLSADNWDTQQLVSNSAIGFIITTKKIISNKTCTLHGP